MEEEDSQFEWMKNNLLKFFKVKIKSGNEEKQYGTFQLKRIVELYHLNDCVKYYVYFEK